MRSMVTRSGSPAKIVLLEPVEPLLQRVDDREVVVDDEVHQRVEDEAGPFLEQMRRRLAALAHLGVRQRRAVADRDDVVRADEDVGLAERDAVIHASARCAGRRTARRRTPRAWAAGGRSARPRPPDRAGRTPPGSGAAAPRRVREADPDELALDLERLADVLDRDVGDAAAAGIGGAVDDLLASVGRRLRMCAAVRLPVGARIHLRAAYCAAPPRATGGEAAPPLASLPRAGSATSQHAR